MRQMISGTGSRMDADIAMLQKEVGQESPQIAFGSFEGRAGASSDGRAGASSDARAPPSTGPQRGLLSFDDMDINGDGVIDREEFDKAMRPRGAERPTAARPTSQAREPSPLQPPPPTRARVSPAGQPASRPPPANSTGTPPPNKPPTGRMAAMQAAMKNSGGVSPRTAPTGGASKPKASSSLVEEARKIREDARRNRGNSASSVGKGGSRGSSASSISRNSRRDVNGDVKASILSMAEQAS